MNEFVRLNASDFKILTKCALYIKLFHCHLIDAATLKTHVEIFTMPENVFVLPKPLLKYQLNTQDFNFRSDQRDREWGS